MFHGISTAGVKQKTQLRMRIILNLGPVNKAKQKLYYEELRWTIHKEILSKDLFNKIISQTTGHTVASSKGTDV